MGLALISFDKTWWVSTLPAVVEIQNLLDSFLLFCIFMTVLLAGILTWALSPGGLAWTNGRNQIGQVPIPGTRGLPFFGSLFSLSHGLAHRTLSCMASKQAATKLMAFSLGSTPAVVTSDPQIAREILTSPHFANRPIKTSAKKLMFNRAIGFAPNGTYWRLLRRISLTHLFAPKRIAAHESGRQLDCAAMLCAIAIEQSSNGLVVLRKHLQAAALNNIMGTVFGKRYELTQKDDEAKELQEIVREGFDILGAFNWSDYLPWLSYFYDPSRINERCSILVPRVKKIVDQIIEEHRINQSTKVADSSDFVDVLLTLDGDEMLNKEDMIAVLWVSTFFFNYFEVSSQNTFT